MRIERINATDGTIVERHYPETPEERERMEAEEGERRRRWAAEHPGEPYDFEEFLEQRRRAARR